MNNPELDPASGFALAPCESPLKLREGKFLLSAIGVAMILCTVASTIILEKKIWIFILSEVECERCNSGYEIGRGGIVKASRVCGTTMTAGRNGNESESRTRIENAVEAENDQLGKSSCISLSVTA